MRRKQLTVSEYQADLATERERQLTTARANQTTGLTNGRATNWAPEAFPSSNDVRVLLLNQPSTGTVVLSSAMLRT